MDKKHTVVILLGLFLLSVCAEDSGHIFLLFVHIEMTFHLGNFLPFFPLYITSRLSWISEFPCCRKLPQISRRLEEKNELYIEMFVYTWSFHLISNRTHAGISELCRSLRDRSATVWSTQLSSDAFQLQPALFLSPPAVEPRAITL